MNKKLGMIIIIIFNLLNVLRLNHKKCMTVPIDVIVIRYVLYVIKPYDIIIICINV